MIIKELVLRNIRSYTDATVTFPEGAILLSGDVGSGKSTILFAIEFALFGAIRGLLGADSLLRKGTKGGYVRLTFDLHGSEVIIERTLKKNKNRVSQEAGYIVEHEKKFIGTATELRAKMTDILSYPEDSFSRKSMIFRYTVYTPQEEMKHILMEQNEARLDTLRKVFGIHKYKTIKENIATYGKHIRDNIIHLQGELASSDEKQQQINKKKDIIKKISQDIETWQPIIAEKQQCLQQKQHELKEKQKEQEQYNQIVHALEKLNAEKILLQQQFSQTKQRMQSIEQKKHITLDEVSIPTNAQDVIEAQLKEKQQQLHNVLQQLKEKEVLQQRMTEEIKKISLLGACPLCKQHVPHEHKDEIIRGYRETADTLRKEHVTLSKQKAIIEKNCAALEEKQKQCAGSWSRYELYVQQKKLLRQQHEQQQKDIHEAQVLLKETKSLIGAKNKEEMVLHDAQGKKPEDLSALKQTVEHMIKEKQQIDVTIAQLQREHEVETKALQQLETEMQLLQKKKEKQQSLEYRRAWLLEKVSPTMSVMEKQVFMSVYHEFNSLFREWFFMLVDDQNFNVQLNDEFTPLIMQNGYEIPLHDLSGGEKTAVSLAYRLALNKVINNLISTIQTKDIIVLDEPTDGFSSQQLNAVRTILAQLGLKQIILVSHEPKIESFVDHVLRIEKRGHESRIC